MIFHDGELKFQIKKYAVDELLLFLYLTYPVLYGILSAVFSVFGMRSLAKLFVLSLIMALYFLLCLQKRKLLVPDFWVLYLLVILFFALTAMVHPEYEYWYTRSDYGVLNYVLRPNNGIFIYLFLRLVNDPKKIISIIKTSAWPIYLWYGFQVIQALLRGYWVDTSNRGYEIHMAYNLSLGYNTLLFVLPFLYSALEERKPVDIIGSFVGIAIILVGGSRGPFLDIGIFLILYILIKISSSRRKYILAASVIVGVVIIWFGFPYLVSGLAAILEKLNLPSRTLTKLLAGEITDDSNRHTIWDAAIKMIEQNPWGYGAMGSRHVIYQYIYVAHPHQFFLEVLIDFGIPIGSFIILWLAYHSVKLFFMKGLDEWKAVFLIFFARACQLLVSLTFWHSIALWGALAIGVCMSRAKRKGIEYGRQQNNECI